MIYTWSRPVTLTSGSGQPRLVTTAFEAAQVLAEKSGCVSGPYFVDATRSCIACIEGAGDHEHAREAFFLAMRHAGCVVEEGEPLATA